MSQAAKNYLKKQITSVYKLFNRNAYKEAIFRVFMYHSVSHSNNEAKNNMYILNSKRFIEQIEYLKNYSTNHIFPLKNIFSSKSKMSFAFTFDDGYKDNLSIVAPLMNKLGIPFTVFITTDYIQSNDRKYLTPNDIKELSHDFDVEIGSHTKSHPRLTTCNTKDATKELIYSKKWLEDLIGKEVDTFSYPQGDVDHRIRELVSDAGYKIARTSLFSYCSFSQDRLLLNSMEIWNSDSLTDFENKIDGHWDWLRWT